MTKGRGRGTLHHHQCFPPIFISFTSFIFVVWGVNDEWSITEWQDDDRDKVGAEACGRRCVYCVRLSTKNKLTELEIYSHTEPSNEESSLSVNGKESVGNIQKGRLATGTVGESGVLTTQSPDDLDLMIEYICLPKSL